VFDRAGQAVMAKIMENETAASALAVTQSERVVASAANAPDLRRERAKAAVK